MVAVMNFQAITAGISRIATKCLSKTGVKYS
jgi:hypothetical protein